MNSLSHTTLRFLEPNTFTDERGTGGRLRTGSFLERYEIIRLLGAGGMGEVYLGRDQRLGRHVAIKILNAEFQKSESDVARFIQQAKAASALNHPNILTIHEIGHGAATKGVERI